MPHESLIGLEENPPAPPSAKPSRRETVMVDNAADKQQVRNARRKDRDRDELWLSVLKSAEDNPETQILLLRILEESSIFLSVWHDNPARMAYNSGRQDFGHWLMAEIERVPGLMQRIMTHQKGVGE